MKNKKSFVLYADFIETFDMLSDEEAGQLIKHIFNYVNDQDPVLENKLLNVAFNPIKQQLKRDLDKWSTIIDKRSDAGKASAEARKNKKEQTSTKSTHVESVKTNSTNPTVTVNDNVNVTVNDNVNVIENDNVINKVKVIDRFPFEDFWIYYDKKVGNKSKIEIKFKKLSDQDKLAIFETLQKYIASTPDKKFRKNPETYLNQRAWEHEIIVDTKTTSSGLDWSQYERDENGEIILPKPFEL